MRWSIGFRPLIKALQGVAMQRPSDRANAVSKRLSDAFGGVHLKCSKQIGIGHGSSNTHQYVAYTECEQATGSLALYAHWRMG
jgi:hypothetical protein